MSKVVGTLSAPGRLNNTQPEENHQSSKRWYITALVVGIVVTGGGIFGILGLIQSYGVTLPQCLNWLTPAINTIGNTQSFWSLWIMAIGCGGAGIIIIALSSCMIHKIRIQDKKLEQTQILSKIDPPENLEQERDRKLEEVRAENQQASINRMKTEAQQKKEVEYMQFYFRDNFDDLKCDDADSPINYQLNPENYSDIPIMTYVVGTWGLWQGKSSNKKFLPRGKAHRFFIILNTHEGMQKTIRITSIVRDELIGIVKKRGYTLAPKTA